MLIREATPDDAAQLIACVQRLSQEPDSTIPLAPGEFQVTIAEEQKLLSEYAAADNSIWLVASMEGHIVGMLNCEGGKRQATRHCAGFGMSVARDHRNQGIGTALLWHMVEWAHNSGILTRLELEVFAHNAPAIHLYRKCGFHEEGLRKNAFIKYHRPVDSLLMARVWG